MEAVKVIRGQGKFSQKIEIRKHTLVADSDLTSGGEDLGPSPHEYLASALGACTAITLQMYASRKSWKLENSEVTVTITKDPDGSRFDRKIHLIGELDETQRARLLDIANHCPVHQTLNDKIRVETTLV